MVAEVIKVNPLLWDTSIQEVYTDENDELSRQYFLLSNSSVFYITMSSGGPIVSNDDGDGYENVT